MTSASDADSAALKAQIRRRIAAEGSISFADFMRTALYDPRHGYYVRRDPGLDYQSSPNVHPVFGAMIARQLAEFWRLLGSPSRFDVWEAGAGDGRLAADVLRYASAAEPSFFDAVRYVLQDVTGRQTEALSSLAAAGFGADKVAAADAVPPEPVIDGCMLSNELLDALPFHRVRRREGRLLEVRAGANDGGFVDVEAPAGEAIVAYFAALGLEPGEGCDAEVCLEAPAWMRRAGRALRRGYLLTLDYGYEAAALYAPWRKAGTLLTFYRHTSGADPYQRVGEQDITASVDFTTAMRAGEAAGLTTLGLTTQTEFLAALGIGGTLAQGPAGGDLEAYYALRRAVIELTQPEGLGRVRVLIQGRDVPATLPAGLVRLPDRGGGG